METTKVELASTIGATLHFALYIFVVLLLVSIPMVALGQLMNKFRVWHAIVSGLILGIVLAQLFHDKAAISLTEQLTPALAIIAVATSLSLTLWAIGFRGNQCLQRRKSMWSDRIETLFK
jgi:cytochrome c biogenesis protein CcdA